MRTYEKYLNEEDASTAYKKSYNSILSNLDKLKKVLKKHSAKQAKNPSDWGYSGDIGYIEGELTELIKNFK